MSEFTIEKIEKAFDKCHEDNSVNYKRDVIAALTEPEWKPEVKQVVTNKANNYEFWRVQAISKNKTFSNWRALTNEEAGLREFVSMAEFVKLRDALIYEVNTKLSRPYQIGPTRLEKALDALPEHLRVK